MKEIVQFYIQARKTTPIQPNCQNKCLECNVKMFLWVLLLIL